MKAQYSAANRLTELPGLCNVVKTPAVHCYCDVCSAAGGHSAGCRMSWAFLQHHATGVTSNGVTVCGSKFPPTVISTANINKAQYPKRYKQCDLPSFPAVVISKVLFPQSSIMAALVHSHSSLFSDVSPGLQTYSNYDVTQCTV